MCVCVCVYVCVCVCVCVCVFTIFSTCTPVNTASLCRRLNLIFEPAALLSYNGLTRRQSQWEKWPQYRSLDSLSNSLGYEICVAHSANSYHTQCTASCHVSVKLIQITPNNNGKWLTWSYRSRYIHYVCP